MKISYQLDENNIIIWWGFPLVEGLPTLEIEFPGSHIHVGYSKLENGFLIENREEYEADLKAKEAEANRLFLASLNK